jgi:hypothetical protein
VTSIDLTTVDRKELEKSVLLYAGLTKRLLKEIRENLKPEWKVRKSCEAIIEKYAPLLSRQWTRGVQAEVAKARVQKTADLMDREVWGGLISGEAVGPQRGPGGADLPAEGPGEHGPQTPAREGGEG